MFFDKVQQGAPDAMYRLKIDADSDHHPHKVDLGVGIYRNEEGVYHELEAVKQAKEHIAATNPTHDYEVTTGNEQFLRHAAALIFGRDSDVLTSHRVASAQAISGTGAIHIALLFVKHSVPGNHKTVYLGTPAWGNYQPMCKLVGLPLETYNHYSPETGQVDWDSVLAAVRGAPRGSIFILQGCCHNPTAADFTEDQWRVLCREMGERQLLPLFDVAYHGLGRGLEEDIFCVRHFARAGMEMLVCQSFAKNFGLYGERVGAVHVACPDRDVASRVHYQICFLIRSEFSSSPAYGARIVTAVLSDPGRTAVWQDELVTLHQRLLSLREKLFHLLTTVYQTPGSWDVITRGSGLFSLLPLSQDQCRTLQTQYHIYMVSSGRITIPGLSEKNLDHVARSIDAVVRGSTVNGA